MHDISLGIAQMHAVALAVTPEGAVGANSEFHPFAVAILPETILPYIPKIIGVNTALTVVGANARTGTDATVEKNRGNRYSGFTFKESIAYKTFITAEKTFATKRGMNPALFSGGDNKIH